VKNNKEFEGWAAENTIAENYLKVCREAVFDEEVFRNFKRDPGYTSILEHVSKKQGIKYLKKVLKSDKNLFTDNLKLFRKNDISGNPYTYKFGKFGFFSPTTIRYINSLIELETLFGALDGMNIFEIGGGYGGLCYIISSVNKFNTYSILDLKEVVRLAKKYLERMNVQNLKYYTPEIITESMSDSIDLFISNYAFSECNRDVQDLYLEKIISRAARGYLTCNKLDKTLTGPYNSDEIKKKLKQFFEVDSYFENIPKTNCEVIVWGNLKMG